eukprot:TRINITY_DN80592_c0_g1_i1.p1 TRINITY_DN80592_c0_g1~~TRINITY_DN80592_c0_g1_i1.p1  ORF type:complete len:1073 (-),score=311.66 TRINITY_DN80592_c0_g1_i1:325-3543(-)
MMTEPVASGGYPQQASAPPSGSSAGAAAAEDDGGNAGRQRSSSPFNAPSRVSTAFPAASGSAHTGTGWEFRLGSQARSSSGMHTPVRATSGARALSGTRGTGGVAAAQQTRASYDSAVLSAVRRQMDAFEEKMQKQISSSRADPAKEAALVRLEERMSEQQSLQPKMDKKISQLTGNVKGLSDEMQAQLRRVDGMDERLWEWRHQMEEEFRQKFNEFNQHVQEVASSIRRLDGKHEDLQRKAEQRIIRLEQDQDETANNVWSRIEALEQAFDENVALSTEGLQAAQNAAILGDSGSSLEAMGSAELLAVCEQRFADANNKLEKQLLDMHEMRTRVEAQEERLRTMRTHLDTQKEQVRSVCDKIENVNWEGELKQLRLAQQAQGNAALKTIEEHKLLAKRVEQSEASYDDMGKALEAMQRVLREEVLGPANHVGPPPLSFAGGDELLGDDGGNVGGQEPAVGIDFAAGLEELHSKLQAHVASELEGQRVSFEDRLAPLREANEVSSRVGSLVASLQEIGPTISELTKRQDTIEDVVKALPVDLTERMQQLEDMCGSLEPRLTSSIERLQSITPRQPDHSALKAELTTTLNETTRELLDSKLAEKVSVAHVDEVKQALESSLQALDCRLAEKIETTRQTLQASNAGHSSADDVESRLESRVLELRQDLERALQRNTNDIVEEKLVVGLARAKDELERSSQKDRCNNVESSGTTREEVEACVRELLCELLDPRLAAQGQQAQEWRAELRDAISELQVRAPADMLTRLQHLEKFSDMLAALQDVDLARLTEERKPGTDVLSTRVKDLEQRSLSVTSRLEEVSELVKDDKQVVSKLKDALEDVRKEVRKLEESSSGEQAELQKKDVNGAPPELLSKVAVLEDSLGRLSETAMNKDSSSFQQLQAACAELRLEMGTVKGLLEAQASEHEKIQLRCEELQKSLVERPAMERQADGLGGGGSGDLAKRLDDLEERLRSISKDDAALEPQLSQLKTELSEAVARIRRDLESLESKVGSAASPTGASSETQLVELLRAVRKDEEDESVAYNKLVSRVDDICEKLHLVTVAVSSVPNGAGAAA